MNEETNQPPPALTAPATCENIIQEFLERAYKVANDKNADTKDVCAFVGLVLKIKEVLSESSASEKPLARGLTTETILSIEQANKIL